MRVAVCSLVLSSIACCCQTSARACDPVDNRVSSGVLGGNAYRPRPVLAVPSNVAFVMHRALFDRGPATPLLMTDLATGEEVHGMEIADAPGVPPDLVLLRPLTPLTPSNRYGFHDLLVRDGQLTVEPPDHVPPAQPLIAGARVVFHDGTGACTQDSCGDYTTLAITLASLTQDDRTHEESISYAVYVGRTAQEARTAPQPQHLLWAQTSLLHFVERHLADEDVFVTVTALDMAGNESARTEPFQANMAAGGCTAPGPLRSLGLGPAAFALALVALLARTKRPALRRHRGCADRRHGIGASRTWRAPPAT